MLDLFVKLPLSTNTFMLNDCAVGESIYCLAKKRQQLVEAKRGILFCCSSNLYRFNKTIYWKRKSLQAMEKLNK